MKYILLAAMGVAMMAETPPSKNKDVKKAQAAPVAVAPPRTELTLAEMGELVDMAREFDALAVCCVGASTTGIRCAPLPPLLNVRGDGNDAMALRFLGPRAGIVHWRYLAPPTNLSYSITASDARKRGAAA